MSVKRRADHETKPCHRGRRHGYYRDDFFGLEIENLIPQSQILVSLAVLVPVAAGMALVLALAPWLWWLIFVFGWMIFPAFGLLIRGIAAGLSEDRPELPASNSKERELLQALREHGELTPARAAMETSLTVAEADGMLKELAEGGHLEVKVRGGGLFYSLWDPESEDAARELWEKR
jgi:hypothetical protein